MRQVTYRLLSHFLRARTQDGLGRGGFELVHSLCGNIIDVHSRVGQFLGEVPTHSKAHDAEANEAQFPFLGHVWTRRFDKRLV